MIENFVTEAEEKILIETIDEQKWASIKNRRVQHYGYEFQYKGENKNKVDLESQMGELPEWTNKMTPKLNSLCTEENKGTNFNQLTINDYFPGDGIPPHVDTHSAFMPAFCSVSLGSGCVMTFKKYDGTLRHVFFPPRCAVIFTDEARYNWYHHIATRKLDKVEGELYFRKRRISLTFRTIRTTPCDCKFPIFCNSQGFDPVNWKFDCQNQVTENLTVYPPPKTQSNIKIEMEKPDDDMMQLKLSQQQETQAKIPGDLEKKYVYEVYDKIADHFSNTRYKPWPRVVEF